MPVQQKVEAKQTPKAPAKAAPAPADDFFEEAAGAAQEVADSDEAEVLDLSETDENAGFEAIPVGVYDANVSDAEYGESQRSGKKMITWKFEIAGGQNAGRTLNYYTVIQSDSGKARLKKMLVRIAPQLDLKTFKPATTPQELVGTPCRLKVTTRMYQGEKRNEIKDVLPPAAEKQFE